MLRCYRDPLAAWSGPSFRKTRQSSWAVAYVSAVHGRIQTDKVNERLKLGNAEGGANVRNWV
jgi:hypothetical protein